VRVAVLVCRHRAVTVEARVTPVVEVDEVGGGLLAQAVALARGLVEDELHGDHS
jgi:hypothetical protein